MKKARSRIVLSLVLCLAFPGLTRAQEIKLPPGVEKLAAKAKETVEVNMDGPMLHWASKFLSAEDPEEKQAAKLVENLKGIYVRSYEFSEERAYNASEVEELRSQFRSPEWQRVVGVRSKRDGDNVDIFFHLENEKMAGIVVIAAEPKELTVVNIVGPIEVEQLADLGGEFGVPRLKIKPLSNKPQAKVEKGDRK